VCLGRALAQHCRRPAELGWSGAIKEFSKVPFPTLVPMGNHRFDYHSPYEKELARQRLGRVRSYAALGALAAVTAMALWALLTR